MPTMLRAISLIVASTALGCVDPGRCTPLPAKFTNVLDLKPRRQWLSGGGYCGELSIQTAALSKGAWLSQDVVRRSSHHGQGNGGKKNGFEVLPTNVGEAARNLKLAAEEWDYMAPKPQAPAFKRWLKSHLARGHPIVWFPILMGDSHDPYGHGDAPNSGAFDHVEPMWGIGSNHPLSDTTVYNDDWIVHGSDHDLEPYYRRLDDLDDDRTMDGNCRLAGDGFGERQMFPCFYKQVTYALAIDGLNVTGSLPVSLTVDGGGEEPNVRLHTAPAMLHGTAIVYGLTKGKQYVLYRYGSTEALPQQPPFDKGAAKQVPFTAGSETWTYQDPDAFPSSSATYYLAAEEAPRSFLQLTHRG